MEGFALSYESVSGGGGGSGHMSGGFSLDPVKAERLEQRLTAGTAMGSFAPHTFPTHTSTPHVPALPTSYMQEHHDSEEEVFDSAKDDSGDSARSLTKHAAQTSIRQGRWAPEEDEQLLQAHKRIGPDFEKCVSIAGLSRTAQQAKRRWALLNKQRSNPDEKDSSPDEPPRKMQKLMPPEPEPTVVHRAELELQHERLKAWQEKLAEQQAALNEREEQVCKREAATIANEARRTLNGQAIIKTLLREKAEQARTASRRYILKNNVRLGQYHFERHGPPSVDYQETWRDGEEVLALLVKRERLQNELSHLSAHTPKRSKKKGDGEESPWDIKLPEVLSKAKVATLKKEIAEVTEKLAHLDTEKKMHMRLVKRQNDEDGSVFNNYPILNERYMLLNLLGKGGFSEVYKSYDLVENRYVACKIHQLAPQWSETKKLSYTRHAVREYEIHKGVAHPAVVSLFDVFKIDGQAFATVLEYCDGGDLDQYLKVRTRLPEAEAKLIIQQIFSGLRYLNSQKRSVIHYDLKPGNILFQEGRAKLTDFGLSKIMEEDAPSMELTSQGAGTYWYLPPECFEVGKQPPRISSKVDVWSVGVVFYQLLYGKKPFGNSLSQHKLLVDHVISPTCTVVFPSEPAVSAPCQAFIRRCLTPSQDTRPDVLTICDDPYILPAVRRLPPARAVTSTTTPTIGASST
eukprot:TRINITY_DN5377_c0_g1_i1.p1 TRINITY_DN5377_c0_g1~~TRINITY_DN5377_c0_g1_i1.p1  ORF type:complete len:687 (+),score=82.33 TRINITY_DN5377_c0_g1_i1:320-2380(+)